MYTLSHVKSQVKAILEAANLDPAFEEPLKVINKALDEYAAELKNHGDGWTDEGETFEFKAKAAPDAGNEWESKYNELHARYVESFLYGPDSTAGGTPTGNAGNTPPPAAPINEPAEPMTYDDLFEPVSE